MFLKYAQNMKNYNMKIQIKNINYKEYKVYQYGIFNNSFLKMNKKMFTSLKVNFSISL